ncbi:hypothetical protein [Sphingomonas oligoaromativorans]|uniref:hypothetical protein n=1 Tax=Sphingomonas oligoaromativorans TaxID=575322 RepID=UPI001421B1EE|nr:hypothetical protein [Sphingomonas oligoaromativorans]NIJ35301.1 hypothetical protein [Sphingomonas oligoaromativorans]
MARSIASSKIAAVSLQAKPAESDPLSWLYLNPAVEGFEAVPGYTFGVLRRTFRGRTNSAAEFCRRKAQPIPPAGGATSALWAVTAEKIEVLLPAGADDRFLEPRLLTEEIDARSVESEQALLTYVTVSFPNVRRVHEAWETARAFARSSFVQRRTLPVILVLHVPARAGSDRDVHCHLLISPRQLDGIGLRGFERSFCHDEGQAIIHAEWLAHVWGWEA